MASAVLDELHALAEMRHRDPGAALERAEELLATVSDDPRAVATASWVLGLALHELGRPREAVIRYRACVRVALRHRLTDCVALGRASMAVSLLSVGQAVRATKEVEAARALARGDTRGVVLLLHGLVQQRTGKLDEAVRTYQEALRCLRRTGDRTSIARLLLNRGILRAYRGELAPALRDLAEAEEIATGLDLPVLVAMAAHNTGFAHGRRGSVPEALAAFDRAQRAYAALGDPARLVAVLESDRCELLLEAGLTTEAREAATTALELLEPTGDLAHLTESRLLLARALLAEGDHRRAAAEAHGAARQLRASGRLPWAALARYVAIQAEVLAAQEEREPPAELLARTRRIADELAAQGWAVESLHVRTLVGRIAIALARPEVARSELARAAKARTRGTAARRAQAWHSTALLRLADGDEVGARAALARGMTVVEEYRATLGATELRAQAAAHGTELARLGLWLALRDGDPAGVLQWAERWRAGALRRPAIHPPDDADLGADLAELRRLHSEVREASLAGRVVRGAATRIAELEASVRNRTLRAPGEAAALTGRVEIRAVREALGARTLVEYVTLEGRLHAVTVTRDAVRLHELGATDEIDREKQYVLFALRRLLSPRSGGDANAVAVAAGRLDELLVAPLGLPPGQPVVVAPTGALHGLPWAALPGVAGRPVTITPSAAVWLRGLLRQDNGGDDRRRGEPPVGDGNVALIVGPHVPGGDDEVAHLARLYERASVLVGSDATTAAALAAIEGADLVHLAAHGTFRADSPMFSSLLLADGPLTVYDLERLRSAPATFVLPACDAATAAVRSGDELLGTATQLLGLGACSVIAPVMPVRDDATAELMVDLHHRMRDGAPPAEALAGAAAASLRRGGPGDVAAAAAFICIGTDDGSGGDGDGALIDLRSVAPPVSPVLESADG